MNNNQVEDLETETWFKIHSKVFNFESANFDSGLNAAGNWFCDGNFILQTQHTEEEKKRKDVDDKNPTLYWEYKWTEDAEAEVLIVF